MLPSVVVTRTGKTKQNPQTGHSYTMVSSVEEVSSSLVREYLSRKGLKKTMACMDEEHPRTEDSINNRSQLRQMLSIEDLYRMNKTQNAPLKTLLEIIVKYHMEQFEHSKVTSNKMDPLQSATTVRVDVSAQTPSVKRDTKAEESPPTFSISKQIKSRSATQEASISQPPSTPRLPETDRLSSHSPTGLWTCDLKELQLVSLPQNKESAVQKEPEKYSSITEISQRSRTNRVRRGLMAGPIPQESNKKRQSRKVDLSKPLFRKEEENGPPQDRLLTAGLHQKSFESSQTEIMSAGCQEKEQEKLHCEYHFDKAGQTLPKTIGLKSKPNVVDLNVSEMVLDDIDDEDDDLQQLSRRSVQTSPARHSFSGRPMDQHTATELKEVLLGSCLNCFRVEWRNQGFTFSETHDLRYGIVQKKGGPCGVLASLQAFFLKMLLFVEGSNKGLQRMRPSNTTRRRCLVLAVAEILWRAGDEKKAIIVINTGTSQFFPTGHYKSEGVLEKIMCFTVDNIEDLQLFLEHHIGQFESETLGCLLLTISAVLSRSIGKVREDMDVPNTTLIGAHGYCTQELVNLLLCGRAVSNVFDNDTELDSGNGNVTLLKGIKGQCEVGMLSLFEHYNISKVGAYLKSPRYPIWVVCSESHFSVLFGLQGELLTSEDKGLEFDLYYYDGLANQQEEIRLTVSVGKLTLGCSDDETDLIPPLELCIRTRWEDASVNWNDTEPIL